MRVSREKLLNSFQTSAFWTSKKKIQKNPKLKIMNCVVLFSNALKVFLGPEKLLNVSLKTSAKKKTFGPPERSELAK